MKHLTLNEIAKLLREGDRYYILTHRRPDGDTIGCAAALCRGLRSLGKTAFVYENAQFTPKFRPYLEGLTASTASADATFVSVDVASEGMLLINCPQMDNGIELAIDHHGTNSEFAEVGYVRAEAAACGEIIMELLELMGVAPDKQIAEALYVAISTDTGCFRYSNTTENTLLCAAKCKAWGADTFPINKTMFMTKRMARWKLESYLVQTVEFYRDGLIGLCKIPSDVQTDLGITEDDIDDISGFAREIEGVEIGIMLRQVEGGNGKISVRTSPNYDAASICARIGGGGHAAAAGATVPGGIAGAKEKILAAIEEELG